MLEVEDLEGESRRKSTNREQTICAGWLGSRILSLRRDL
mgnify:CR=1 FL=1